jgi:hypothetical protein
MDWHFNSDQQRRALALLESLPWGDLDTSLRILEDALRRAMEATRREFQAWEQEFGPQLEERLGFDDEFPAPTAEIDALPCQAKLAYVARLLRTMALAYGVSADYSRVNGIVVGDNHPGTPAALIRGLNDILWT